MLTYTVFPVDGPPVVYEREDRATLAELQAWVGGNIQVIPAHWAYGLEVDGVVLGNEDGLPMRLAPNAHARVAPNGYTLVGPLVAIEGDDAHWGRR